MNKIRLMIAVAADVAAQLIAVLNEQNIAADIQVLGSAETSDDTKHEAKIDAQVRAANRARRTTASVERQTVAATKTATRKIVAGSRPGRIVLYTPAGTAAQIRKTLAAMPAGTMGTAVYADLVKHPGSLNADVRKRLARTFEKAGKSIESVDNLIWLLTKKGTVRKSAGE